MKRTRIVIVNRQRFFACILAASALIASVTCVLAVKHARVAFAHAEPTVISVSAGDTLWSIASEYAGGKDIRSMIDDIMDMNGLTSADIHVGDTLMIPN